MRLWDLGALDGSAAGGDVEKHHSGRYACIVFCEKSVIYPSLASQKVEQGLSREFPDFSRRPIIFLQYISSTNSIQTNSV